MFALNIMVNEFTCTRIVRSASIMIVSIFCKKRIHLKLGGIKSCHIFVTQQLLNLIIFYGLRRQLNIFIKKFIIQCVNKLFELIFLSKVEL